MKIPSYRLALTALTCVVLSGCASISSVPAGTSYATVVKEFGNPEVSCPLPDGSTRMIWSQEPAGEQVWVTTVGSDRRIGSFQQVMSPNMFDKLAQNTWNSAQIRCEFGEPALIQSFPEHPNRVVWEYRFMGAGDAENYMMLYVSFDRNTNQMINYSTGPDPQYNLLITGN